MRDIKPANARHVGQTTETGFRTHRIFDQAAAGQPLDRLRRGLTQRDRLGATGPRPKGLSFDIADLARAQSWTVAHDWRMRIRLDHGAEGEEYEEVIELQAKLQPHSKTIIWRHTQAVFVQPLPGKRQRYRSLQDALEGLLASHRGVGVSDIVATTWPTSKV
jgi:hypothetical protein